MMKWTGKVVGGVIGMLAGGPIGAALGALLGHQFDSPEEAMSPEAFERTASPADTAAQFFRSTFQVMGHVAKSDGRVSEREVAAARAVMNELRLDAPQVRAAIDLFTIGKQRGFDLAAELASLRRACAGRPDLLRIFVEIQVRAALAGNNLEGPARRVMAGVASNLGLSNLELAQIEAVLRIHRGRFESAPQQDTSRQLAQAYSVLEVTASVSHAEVVKAYRRQLSRHHPDKLKANGLPESMIEHAKERTQQIIEAYELIKARRGI